MRGGPSLAYVSDWEAKDSWGHEHHYREFDFMVDVDGDLDRPRLERDQHVDHRWLREGSLSLLDENRGRDGGMMRHLVQLALGVFGPLAKRGREELVKRVTAAVLAAEGSENTMVEAHRVWVHLRQIRDGHWAGFGEVFTLSDAAAYALNTHEPGSRIDRMRQAALESVGALTAE